MSLLKAEPSGPVKSLAELFAIAFAMEQEAAGRYAALGVQMRSEGETALAEAFEKLAADEREHLDSITDWSQQAHGRAPDPALIRWTAPETFDDEGAASADPRLLSTYRALSMAVRNEERAFAFWSYVAAHASSADIRTAAETLAYEELGHVSLLRRERRKAFHRERRLADSGSETPTTAAGLERRLADALDAAARSAGPSCDATLLQFAAEAHRLAGQLDQGAVAIPITPVPPNLDAPLAIAEFLVDRYLEAADQARDEAAMTLAQALAARAINRLAWLRTDLPELD
ncbi:ferritin family protein [Bosea sp. BIWAKO-01]|uniref:ferritin-like domain-containing protein n=1 Tax=Bosea sp. BIWAKO-01 TaxID=506668 RepID=UPI000853D684|nr:ferritin family protein [Bosea sp. BIWAKO-01]GAU87066.1 ferredoxin [Bosea sp. BIWAKO-01]